MLPAGNRFVRVFLSVCTIALAGCASLAPRHEPLNLSTAKSAVARYCDDGIYDRDLAAVAAEASAWLEARVARRLPGERLAIVFDIDETLLSHAALYRRLDYAYIPAEWDAWLEAARAPAIAPVKALFLQARRRDVAVFLLTGRRDPDQRACTERNLRAEGLGDYTRLIMAEAKAVPLTNVARKTAQRAALAAAGWVIIANLGDQASDLTGGWAERAFKLPNPFYLTE